MKSDYKPSKEVRQRQLERRRAKRKAIIARAKAGGCDICGYNKCPAALEFHHINDDKSDAISNMKSSLKMEEEIGKCICVCANCHREIHAGLVPGY